MRGRRRWLTLAALAAACAALLLILPTDQFVSALGGMVSGVGEGDEVIISDMRNQGVLVFSVPEIF